MAIVQIIEELMTMRKATRVAAAALGIFAGIGGPEHGYFEILRGNTRPASLMIEAMGPPCDPETVWHLCEPALTVIPNFLVTGIIATLLGILTMGWAAFFVHSKRGGLVLILLSIALLLTGGGLFPPVIGIVAGVIASKINAPITRSPARVTGFLSRLWPWPLVAFYTWVFGQFVIGYLANDFLMSLGYVAPLMILSLMVLAIVSAAAYDIESLQTQSQSQPRRPR
jgi:hypothetical protein